MPVAAGLTAYLGFNVTPETAGRVRAWADALGIKPSALEREIFELGFAMIESRASREDLLANQVWPATLQERAGGGVLSDDDLARYVELAPRGRWPRERTEETRTEGG